MYSKWKYYESLLNNVLEHSFTVFLIGAKNKVSLIYWWFVKYKCSKYTTFFYVEQANSSLLYTKNSTVQIGLIYTFCSYDTSFFQGNIFSSLVKCPWSHRSQVFWPRSRLSSLAKKENVNVTNVSQDRDFCARQIRLVTYSFLFLTSWSVHSCGVLASSCSHIIFTDSGNIHML